MKIDKLYIESLEHKLAVCEFLEYFLEEDAKLIKEEIIIDDIVNFCNDSDLTSFSIELEAIYLDNFFALIENNRRIRDVKRELIAAKLVYLCNTGKLYN